MRSINASVIQGSGVGPSAYVVGASDLHPIYPENKMVEYADDTYLLVGEKNEGHHRRGIGTYSAMG